MATGGETGATGATGTTGTGGETGATGTGGETGATGGPAGVLARLGSLIPSLRESERKIGEYVLAHAPEVVYQSITDLADRTATSEATVIRFARQLGYAGYAALKIALALELRAAARQLPSELIAGSDAVSIAQRVIQLGVDSLGDTAQLLDGAALERAVEALSTARRVELYGLGSSAVVAQAAYTVFLQLGLPAAVLTDPHLQAVAASQLGRGDVALAISQSGSSRDTVEAMQLARDAGATTICLTRYARSPITKVADITLLAAARPATVGGLPMFGTLAQFVFVDILAAAVAARRPASAGVLAQGRQAISSKRF
jgi:RpiR family carbohydrate utilization transcriptional regulator